MNETHQLGTINSRYGEAHSTSAAPAGPLRNDTLLAVVP